MSMVIVARPNDKGVAEVQFFCEVMPDGGVLPIDCRMSFEEEETDNMASWLHKVDIEAVFLNFHDLRADEGEFGILNAQRALTYYEGPIYQAENGVVLGKYYSNFFDESGEAQAGTTKPRYADPPTLKDDKVSLFALTITLKNTAARSAGTRASTAA